MQIVIATPARLLDILETRCKSQHIYYIYIYIWLVIFKSFTRHPNVLKSEEYYLASCS